MTALLTGLVAALLMGFGGLLLGLRLAQSRWMARSRAGWRRLSARRLLGWIDASPSGWLILDRGDRLVHLNQRAQRLLEIDGSRLWHGLPFDQLSRDRTLLDAVELARRQDRPVRRSWQSAEGELELQLLPAAGGWLALLLNSRRSLEAQLSQQERWVSDVAHELKTPLTALSLVGESLAQRATSANAVQVDRLQRELRRLQQLVADLLELSRLENALPEATEGQPVFEAADLIDQVWQSLRPLAEQRQVGLQLQRPPQLPLVCGDGARVHRALLNLLDNALRYSPDGGCIQLTLTARGRWCVLAVRDQGPGFSGDDLTHLFERFYRGDPSRVRDARTGSGLGLAIVQQIAVSCGGQVQASNHRDGGALVELILPALPRVPAERPASFR